MQIPKRDPPPHHNVLILSTVQSILSITLICIIVPEMVSDVLPSFFPLIVYCKFKRLNSLNLTKCMRLLSMMQSKIFKTCNCRRLTSRCGIRSSWRFNRLIPIIMLGLQPCILVLTLYDFCEIWTWWHSRYAHKIQARVYWSQFVPNQVNRCVQILMLGSSLEPDASYYILPIHSGK